MSACLVLGATLLALSEPRFTLSWLHSVERVEWHEDWALGPEGLRLLEFRLRGSGAGMEPGPGAVLRAGWWVSPGDLMVPSLLLASSGATPSTWRLCADGVCHQLGAVAGAPIPLRPCTADEAFALTAALPD